MESNCDFNTQELAVLDAHEEQLMRTITEEANHQTVRNDKIDLHQTLKRWRLFQLLQ